MDEDDAANAGEECNQLAVDDFMGHEEDGCSEGVHCGCYDEGAVCCYCGAEPSESDVEE